MAFHTCDTAVASCSDPANHTVRIAGSQDGTSWALASELSSFSGSVPDLFEHEGYLYLFFAGTSAGWKQLSPGLCVMAESSSVSLSSSTDTGGYVDPSLITDGGIPYLFYLPGVLGGDPAGCTSYPCTKEIHAATGSSSLTSFTQVAISGASKTLNSGTFSDPDILKFGNTYFLYVSSGQTTLVFTAASITGPYSEQGSPISNGEGGVPSAVVGGDGKVWLYVTTSSAGVETIRMAKSANGTSVSESFSTVVSSTTLTGLASTVSISSPSVVAKPASW